ncbi:MAG: flagellar biosynthetic protein FliR [Mycobacterium leprae]
MEQYLAQLPALLLVSCRMGGLVTASPVFNNKFMPAQSRVAFTFLLAILLWPAVKVSPAAAGTAGLLVGCVLELLVGLLLGFMSLLVFATLQMAGAWLDLDMGFSMAQVLDPTTGVVEPLLGTFFNTFGLVLYLTTNGHHLLIRALATSYDNIPAGGLLLQLDSSLRVVNLFSSFLSAAIQMVLPFMAVMLLMTVALAGINRAMPQFNVFSLGLGMKAIVGIAMMIVLMPYLLGFLEALFQGGHAQMLETLKLFAVPPS